MKKTKGFKYYAFIFAVSAVAIAIYAIFVSIRGDIKIDFQSVVYLLFLPVMFTGLLFIFDKLFGLIIPAKYKEGSGEMTEFEQFHGEVNALVDSSTSFSIEEYRRLRESVKFQKAISQVFTVKKHGENPELTWEYLSRKFKKGSNECVALNLIIDSVEK